MTALTLLDADGTTRAVALAPAPSFAKPRRPLESRGAYAAAHGGAKAHPVNTPGRPAQIERVATRALTRPRSR